MASRKRDQKTDTNQHARDNGEELPWAVVYYLTPEPITETLRGLFDRRAEAKGDRLAGISRAFTPSQWHHG